jgi:hypothetical protein
VGLKADAVGGHLQTVFEESDHPTDGYRYVEGLMLKVFQMAVPGIGHEKVGADQQEDGKQTGHKIIFSKNCSAGVLPVCMAGRPCYRITIQARHYISIAYWHGVFFA